MGIFFTIRLLLFSVELTGGKLIAVRYHDKHHLEKW